MLPSQIRTWRRIAAAFRLFGEECDASASVRPGPLPCRLLLRSACSDHPVLIIRCCSCRAQG
ncbi:hypothetical protein RBY4I_1385 [Rhodobacterales bacterium Y4I]|nr:hypothetical protein RBY4I_1385 [Rhodobacterales bacterium Y4I]